MTPETKNLRDFEERLIKVETKQARVLDVLFPEGKDKLDARVVALEHPDAPTYFEQQIIEGQKEIKEKLDELTQNINRMQNICTLNCGEGGRVDTLRKDVDENTTDIVELEKGAAMTRGFTAAILAVMGMFQGVWDYVRR